MGPKYVKDLARIYTSVGEFNAALDQIEYLLSIPSVFSVPILELEPEYDPLRSHPRYQKIIAKYKS